MVTIFSFYPKSNLIIVMCFLIQHFLLVIFQPMLLFKLTIVFIYPQFFKINFLNHLILLEFQKDFHLDSIDSILIVSIYLTNL